MSSTTASTERGQYVLVESAVPGAARTTIGVLLIDPQSDRARARFRRDWEEFLSDPEDIEYFAALEDDLSRRAVTVGASHLMSELESSLSHSVLITDRETALVDDWDKALLRLYRRHVSPKVLPFRTHLPLYSARIAAGSFGEAMESESEGWVEAPRDLRIQKDMFVALVTGRSMLPRIQPDTLCVFRGGQALVGSRDGKLVLVENYGETGENRYTIKRYRSDISHSDDGSWEHTRIVLEPLNSEFQPWELEPGRIEVRGIFVRELDR